MGTAPVEKVLKYISRPPPGNEHKVPADEVSNFKFSVNRCFEIITNMVSCMLLSFRLQIHDH